MPTDEGDSGVEAMSQPESREESPKAQKSSLDVPAPNTGNPFPGDEDDDDSDLDETLAERLWGLTEMFPESLRNGVSSLVFGTFSGTKWMYGFSRSALWILFSSSAILLAPVIFEIERMQMEEMSRQQQRQILLGPSAAMSGGAGGSVPGLNMLSPPAPPQPQR
ncbi:mitochondrial import receptor subunit TOM22 homolog [Ornithodoros turicata]|uniref:Mitochondrial import receptor subunit TOM22 homolog n=1 Tax=Ornithodoros turicata TaxID=34597 RepID=A0A2R5LNG9_9ACAR